jgi:hypothetical protein
MLTVVEERRECAKKKEKEEYKTILYIMIFVFLYGKKKVNKYKA